MSITTKEICETCGTVIKTNTITADGSGDRDGELNYRKVYAKNHKGCKGYKKPIRKKRITV